MQITKIRSSSVSECSICLSKHNSDTVQVLCSHRFHVSCIDQWLCSSNTFPLCREVILLSSDFNAYVEPYGIFEWAARFLERHDLIERENQEREIRDLFKITAYTLGAVAVGFFGCCILF